MERHSYVASGIHACEGFRPCWEVSLIRVSCVLLAIASCLNLLCSDKGTCWACSIHQVLNLEPYDDWTLRIKKPYGLMLHNPDAFPHRWALRIEIEDGRVPIGGVFSEGSFDFYLRVAYDWSEEPHLNAHKVSLDALGCPSALDKRHLLGL